ncbi:hypothetical protein [Streptomyces sp. NPDC020681]|uniref:hypothetical protein n=1 Tax=Streptomyces sp. NPDC020681 TaxID=3365083 RepID=UPI0037907FD4
MDGQEAEGRSKAASMWRTVCRGGGGGMPPATAPSAVTEADSKPLASKAERAAWPADPMANGAPEGLRADVREVSAACVRGRREAEQRGHERKAEHFLAFVGFAGALICYRRYTN